MVKFARDYNEAIPRRSRDRRDSAVEIAFARERAVCMRLAEIMVNHAERALNQSVDRLYTPDEGR